MPAQQYNRILSTQELDAWAERIAPKIAENYQNPKPMIELIGPIPVSLQANGDEKEKVRKFLRKQTSRIPWVYLGDITITVQWYINDRIRYENDSIPDIDNVLKPILDSISGPHGVLVDDCQIVHVNITQLGGWVDGYERFDLKIEVLDRENFIYAKKNTLKFQHIKNGICWPLINEECVAGDFYDLLMRTIDSSDINAGFIQRFYHRSRLREWNVVN